MNSFLVLPPKDKREYILEAAARLGLSPVIIEKDFWVCFVLEKLFQFQFSEYLTFKGGTSLSKVYGLIGRFSEDIDLTIDKEFVNSFGNATSVKPSKITKQSKKVVAEHLLPELQTLLSEYGKSTLSQDDDQTILFHYKSLIDENHDYIKKQVRIELGARGEREPSTQKNITPYLMEALPEAFDENIAAITVTVLTAERTFWEKATILHSIAHRPHDRPLQERMSRHYHDLYMLSQNTDLLESAIQDHGLLQQVVSHKKEYFREKWNWYDSAEIGSLVLAPPDHLLKHLEKDYEKTKVMLFENDPISYEELVKNLQALETQINKE